MLATNLHTLFKAWWYYICSGYYQSGELIVKNVADHSLTASYQKWNSVFLCFKPAEMFVHKWLLTIGRKKKDRYGEGLKQLSNEGQTCQCRMLFTPCSSCGVNDISPRLSWEFFWLEEVPADYGITRSLPDEFETAVALKDKMSIVFKYSDDLQ